VVQEHGTIIGAMLLDGNEMLYLVVSASHRRKGIGRILLGEAKSEGRWARVTPANAAMIKLLESEGFRYDADRLTPAGWHAYQFQS
jgi:ribosomal protein S18 acetylase RimI-like enzyme